MIGPGIPYSKGSNEGVIMYVMLMVGHLIQLHVIQSYYCSRDILTEVALMLKTRASSTPPLGGFPNTIPDIFYIFTQYTVVVAHRSHVPRDKGLRMAPEARLGSRFRLMLCSRCLIKDISLKHTQKVDNQIRSSDFHCWL